MVRLKVPLRRQHHQGVHVFQFHYGTIKSSVLIMDCIRMPCFNSTMVRLKAGMQEFYDGEKGVSIPLWYD